MKIDLIRIKKVQYPSSSHIYHQVRVETSWDGVFPDDFDVEEFDTEDEVDIYLAGIRLGYNEKLPEIEYGNDEVICNETNPNHGQAITV